MVQGPVCRPRDRRSWLWLPIVVAAGVLGCAEGPESGQAGGEPTMQTDRLLLAAAKVALPPPGMGAEDLPDPDSPGAEALQRYCVTCHALPTPGAHSATDWPGVVRRMWLRIDGVADEFNLPRPTVAERIVTLRYLLDNALEVTEAELPSGPGRELFTETCAKCHELPDPQQHSPDDWVAVVMRMSDHMEEMLGETVTRSQLEQLVGYLERASGRS